MNEITLGNQDTVAPTACSLFPLKKQSLTNNGLREKSNSVACSDHKERRKEEGRLPGKLQRGKCLWCNLDPNGSTRGEVAGVTWGRGSFGVDCHENINTYNMRWGSEVPGLALKQIKINARTLILLNVISTFLNMLNYSFFRKLKKKTLESVISSQYTALSLLVIILFIPSTSTSKFSFRDFSAQIMKVQLADDRSCDYGRRLIFINTLIINYRAGNCVYKNELTFFKVLIFLNIQTGKAPFILSISPLRK